VADHEEGTFRKYAQDGLSPTVFRGPWGERVMGAFVGMTGDLLAEADKQAVSAGMVGSATFPADGMVKLGNERRLPRYEADTDATYKARLQDAWDAWTKAGGQAGIKGQLEAYGLSNITFKIDSDWNWDGTSYKSRFWVLIGEGGHPWLDTQHTYGDGSKYDSSYTYGSTATPSEVAVVRDIVRRFKAGDEICANIIVIFDDTAWAAAQPNGTWGRWENRNAAAVYWRG